MNEKVLITGASGFIGYHLVQAALEKGYEVHAGVRRSSNVDGLEELGKGFGKDVPGEGRLKLVYPDYSSKESLVVLLKEGGYNYIIHAAGATKATDRVSYNRINAEYTLNLALAALNSGIPLKRFVFMSSLAALGPLGYDEKYPITENSDPNPVTSYGASKLLAEEYLLELKELPLTVIRPTAVFGPREKDLFILFETLNKGFDLYIGKNPQRLSFVYVKDLVSATLAAMKETKKEPTFYNISDGQQYGRYELAELFKELSGRKAFRMHLPVGLISVFASLLETGAAFFKKASVLNKEKINELTAANWYCSIDAARKGLNYNPGYTLRQGLNETLGWYKQNNWL